MVALGLVSAVVEVALVDLEPALDFLLLPEPITQLLSVPVVLVLVLKTKAVRAATQFSQQSHQPVAAVEAAGMVAQHRQVEAAALAVEVVTVQAALEIHRRLLQAKATTAAPAMVEVEAMAVRAVAVQALLVLPAQDRPAALVAMVLPQQYQERLLTTRAVAQAAQTAVETHLRLWAVVE